VILTDSFEGHPPCENVTAQGKPVTSDTCESRAAKAGPCEMGKPKGWQTLNRKGGIERYRPFLFPLITDARFVFKKLKVVEFF
jgi:hypothetical protein